MREGSVGTNPTILRVTFPLIDQSQPSITMWLINTATIELEYFAGPEDAPRPGVPELPRYAILSHTWGKEEVTFQELRALKPIDPVRSKSGFAKIEKTCELARQFGRNGRYVWIDTCCIDKTSSAELSESINAMYQYYNKAYICFVWLDDWKSRVSWDQLKGLPYKKASVHAEDPPEGVLRWFTRGWTLQELIAPEKVQFYDRSWTLRGSKNEPHVLKYLSRITGIPEVVLEDSHALEFQCLGKRMSWAAYRHTSRIEDMAYCLLGLFGVNMPLLYGEGPKAFIRLQEEILRTSTDFSLFAWQSNQPWNESCRIRGLLAPSTREFVSLWNCERVRPTLTGLHVQTEELVVTNKGIRIDTSFLFQDEKDPGLVSQSEYLLYLGCMRKGSLVAIRIRQLSEGIYGRVRVRAGDHWWETTRIKPEIWKRRVDPRTIYLIRDGCLDRTDKRARKFGYLRVAISCVRKGKNPGFAFLDIWPPNQPFTGVSSLDSIGTHIEKQDSNTTHVRIGTFPPAVGYIKATFDDGSGPEFLIVYRRTAEDFAEVYLCQEPAVQRVVEFTGGLGNKDPLTAESDLYDFFGTMLDGGAFVDGIPVQDQVLMLRANHSKLHTSGLDLEVKLELVAAIT